MNTENSGIFSHPFGALGIGLALMAPNTVSAAAPSDAEAGSGKRMNVLFFMSDDMRTDWNVYGHPQMHTPNLDKLASQGVLFQHNYCQYPLSGPSRTSLFSGHRPTTTKIYNNSPWFGADHPDWISLTMYFKKNGYTTYSSGKLYHAGIEDTESFDFGGRIRRRHTGVGDFKPSYVSPKEHEEFVARMKQADLASAAHSDRWEALENTDTVKPQDTQTADQAIEWIKTAATKDEPFFIGCGLVKPHSPFEAPKEFFDLYNLDEIELPEDFATYPMIPLHFPEGSIRENTADFFISRRASDREAKEFLRAYWACISYADWNVGRVLAALDEAGLRENTIIVFCVDHGYQLGEKGKWSKAGSLWEEGTNVPLLIVDPRSKGNGKICYKMAENLDIFPTLIDLCGLPEYPELEGTSLRPLLDNPDLATWDKPAYSVWDNHGKGVTGVSVRVDRWRYAEFFGVGAGEFLIDEDNDPHEMVNLARDPQYADIVARLRSLGREYVKGQRELTEQEAALQGR